MEENRYKRLTNLFINRINTIEMMNVFEGRSKAGLKVYRNDSEDNYHYLFVEPIKGRLQNIGYNGEEIKYELYLNKNKNLATIVYFIRIIGSYEHKQFATTYAMNVFKKCGFKKYTYKTDPISHASGLKLKVKAVIEVDADMSNVFKALEIFDKMSYKAVHYEYEYYNCKRRI